MITGELEAEPDPSGSTLTCVLFLVFTNSRSLENKRFKKKTKSERVRKLKLTPEHDWFCLVSAPPRRSSPHCSLMIIKVLTRLCSVTSVCLVQSSCCGYRGLHSCRSDSGSVRFPVFLRLAARCCLFIFSVFPLRVPVLHLMKSFCFMAFSCHDCENLLFSGI